MGLASWASPCIRFGYMASPYSWAHVYMRPPVPWLLLNLGYLLYPGLTIFGLPLIHGPYD